MSLTILIHNPGAEPVVFENMLALKQCETASTVWVDMHTDDPEEFRLIANHFGLHELAVEDCFTPGHFPKLDDYGSYLFMIFRGLKAPHEVEAICKHRLSGDENIPEELADEENEEIYTRKVAVFLSDRFIITFRRKEVPWLDAVARQVSQFPERSISGGTDALAHRVLDVLIDRFYRGLGFFEQTIEGMEDRVIEASESFDFAGVLMLKRDLSSLRQLLREQRAVIARLASDTAFVKTTQRRYFRDIDDHAFNCIKFLDKEIDSLHGLRDSYFAINNARLGDTMRILAIITTIAAPLNIIVGIYGMNFEAMPLLHSNLGFWTILISMTVMALGMLVLFRKKRWF